MRSWCHLPDADIESNLALALKLVGRVGDAVVHARNAFRHRTDRRSASALVDCLKLARFEATAPDLEADLAALIACRNTDRNRVSHARDGRSRVTPPLPTLFRH